MSNEDFQHAVSGVKDLKKSNHIVDQAHKHCANHREELNRSDNTGCFYCCEIYSSDLIDEWIDADTTAICPKCGIDAVIGDASGFPVTDKAFLKAMNEAWF